MPIQQQLNLRAWLKALFGSPTDVATVRPQVIDDDVKLVTDLATAPGIILGPQAVGMISIQMAAQLVLTNQVIFRAETPGGAVINWMMGVGVGPQVNAQFQLTWATLQAEPITSTTFFENVGGRQFDLPENPQQAQEDVPPFGRLVAEESTPVVPTPVGTGPRRAIVHFPNDVLVPLGIYIPPGSSYGFSAGVGVNLAFHAQFHVTLLPFLGTGEPRG